MCIIFPAIGETIMQLEMFPRTDMQILDEKIESVRQVAENVRKGIFSRNNELSFLVMELKKEIEEIKDKLFAAGVE